MLVLLKLHCLTSNRQKVKIYNFLPRQIADFIWKILVLGVVLEDGGVGLI